MSKYHLSEAEYEIMEFLWEREEEVTLQEVIAYCSNKGREWKPQTIHTFLTRLMQKEVILVRKKGQKCYYLASMTLDELKKRTAHQILEENFHGSLRKFLTAFTGGKSISEEDRNVLREFLNE